MDKEFWTTFLLTQAAPFLVPILLFIVSFIGLKFFAKNKEDIAYAKAALSLVKTLLGDRLGEKGKLVFDIWLKGLDAVSDGDFSRAEVIDQFVEHVKAACKTRGIELSESDVATIRQAAETMFQMLNIKSKPTQKALRLMMAENS